MDALAALEVMKVKAMESPDFINSEQASLSKPSLEKTEQMDPGVIVARSRLAHLWYVYICFNLCSSLLTWSIVASVIIIPLSLSFAESGAVHCKESGRCRAAFRQLFASVLRFTRHISPHTRYTYPSTSAVRSLCSI